MNSMLVETASALFIQLIPKSMEAALNDHAGGCTGDQFGVTIKSEPYDPVYDGFRTSHCEVQQGSCPLLVPQTHGRQADSCNGFAGSDVKQEWLLDNGAERSVNLYQKNRCKAEPQDDLMADVKDEVGNIADEETVDADKEPEGFDDGSEPEEESTGAEVPLLEGTFFDKDQLGCKKHTTMHHSESFHKCVHCQKMFDNKVVLNCHLYKVSARPDEPHSCAKCGEYVKCRTHLWAHLLTHKGKTPDICKECGMVSKTDETMKKHMLHKHIKSVHTCEVCQTVFESMVELLNHLLTHRGVLEQNKCLLCSETFEKKEDLFEHLLSHNEKSFICKVCLKAFDTKENLTPHSCDLQYCNLCLKTFNSNEELREHRSLHNVGEGLKVCLECGKTFTLTATYTKHMRHYHENGPFPCKECNKMFDKRSELMLHLRNEHSRKGVHFCDECKLDFNSWREAKAHRNTHKHRCNGCTRRYKNLQMFLKHTESCLKKHTEYNRESISSSDPSAPQLLIISAQEDSHHAGEEMKKKKQSHSCTFCNQTFKERGELENHQMMKHRGVNRIESDTETNFTVARKHNIIRQYGRKSACMPQIVETITNFRNVGVEEEQEDKVERKISF